MLRRTVSLVILLVLASYEAGGVSSTQVSRDAFCERLVKIVCEASLRCYSEDADDDSCEEFRRSQCDEWHHVLSSPGLAGDADVGDDLPNAFRFRGDAAAAYLREIRRTGGVAMAFDWRPEPSRSA